ncbi:hypothetical protein, partial [Klebsiella pneumoniae]|uniref:hypothetical protein n=1 Tax=Klebsiella pneumoniae TaxID=573 RepID=UPI003012EE32
IVLGDDYSRQSVFNLFSFGCCDQLTRLELGQVVDDDLFYLTGLLKAGRLPLLQTLRIVDFSEQDIAAASLSRLRRALPAVTAVERPLTLRELAAQ